MKDALRDTLREVAAITRCPRTGGALETVSREELEGRLTAASRSRLPPAADGALISAAAGLAFPRVRGVVRFLDAEALEVATPDGAAVDPTALGDTAFQGAAVHDTAVHDAVRAWYDDYGWQRTADGAFGDTALFSQQGHRGHGFYEVQSHLRLMRRLTGGDYLLDAASGPLAHPEYLSYSWFHRRRVCVDFSLTALEAAAERLGPHGLYLQADLRRLPFPDGLFHGVVSGYTVQHIAAEDQGGAVGELYRVLAPGHALCIMTNLAPGLPARLLRGLLRRWPRKTVSSPAVAAEDAPPLYCHLRDRGWWRRLGRGLGADLDLEPLRLLQRDEFCHLFGDSTRAARRLLAAEERWPRLLRAFAEYGLLVFSKELPGGTSGGPS